MKIPPYPIRLYVSEIPDYILTKYRHRVPVATVRNWISRGRRGHKLRLVVPFHGGTKRRQTSSVYLDEFLSKATKIR